MTPGIKRPGLARRCSASLAMIACAVLLLPAVASPLTLQASVADATHQPPSAAVFRFEHLSVEQGLSQSTVAAILQDSFGFMWFGTDDGLNRYDGHQVTILRHDPDDASSLSLGGIRGIYEDHTGDLWIRTTSGGLDRYDRDGTRFIHYRGEDGGLGTTPEDFASVIFEDRAGTLWIGTRFSGLFRYDRADDRFVQLRHDPVRPGSLSSDRVSSIIEDRAGQLWVGTEVGLDRLDRATGVFTHFRHDAADPHTLAGERVQRIYEDREGRLWVATYGTGLSLFDPVSGRATRFVHDPLDPRSIDESTTISDLLEDSQGYLWVRHVDGRLDRLDPAQAVFQRFRLEPAEDGNALISDSPGGDASFIAEDRTGTIWVGTFGGGLGRFDPDREQFVHYRHTPYEPASLSDNQLLSFCEDDAGGLWIGTYGHGVDRFDPAQIQFAHYRIDPQAADAAQNNIVLDIREDHSGLVWTGTPAGLSSIDRATGEVTRYLHDPQEPDSLGAERVWSVFEDDKGQLWVGTEDSLDRLDPATGRFAHYRNTRDGSPAPYGMVTAIVADGAGGLWLGVYGRGLEHFDATTGQITHVEYHTGEGQTNPSYYWLVWTVYRDRAGRIWIGTTTGLYSLDPDTDVVTHYGHDAESPGSLSSNEIHAVHEDSAGRLWVGTWGGGLNRLDRSTGQTIRYTVNDGLPNNTVYCILEDPTGTLWLSTNNGISRFDPDTESFTNYDSGDGLQSNEFNTGSCSISASGEMFFGGVNGFNTFFPDRVVESRTASPVVLTALTREGKPLAHDRALERLSELTLRWPEDGFEFEFAALNYSQSQKTLYAYRLVPLEVGWTQIGNRRFGSYTNLSGGKYALELKASDSTGVWSDEDASLAITVVPPFWETWTFRGVLSFMLAALAFVAYRWRVASIESRSRQLAVEVAERTLTIAGQTADLEALYQADAELEQHVQLDQVLQALVDIAVDRLRADRSAVWAWDDLRERLVVRVARNFSADAVDRIAFAPGDGFVWQVMTTGEPVVVEDAVAELQPEGDSRRTSGVTEPPEIVEIVLREGIRSFMHIPIRPPAEVDVPHGEVFGVFNVCYDEPRGFGEREQRLFTALAQRASLAVRNAQHFAREQRRAEQFRVISEVGRGLASILDINELLREIVRLIQGAFGYDHVGLALIEGDEAVYRVGAGKLWDDPNFAFAPDRLRVGSEGITGWVAGSGEMLLAPDVSLEPRYVWLRGSSTRSELTVPLKVAGKVIGVLDAQSERLNAFDESDVAVMQSLASQAAVAIENARLYADMGKQVAELTALQETNRAMASTLERDALLKLIMDQATSLVQADGGLINLVDWERHEDEVVACSGAAAQFQGARNALSAGLSGWVALHNQPIIVNRLDQDGRVAQATLNWLEQCGVESAALAPLRVKKQVVGTLVLIKENGRGGFDEGGLDLLVAFAEQASIAIENARLYEEAQQTAASQERSRLARDLHDAVTQTLFSASLIAEVLPALWESDANEGRELLAELRQLTRGALAEMRTLLLELRPAALLETDLGDLLRQLTESVSGRTGIPIALDLVGCQLPELPEEVHVALYRVAQEALNNIVKHARAKGARVAVCCSRKAAHAEQTQPDARFRVELLISDDGCGFDPATVSPDHLGLSIIRERAQAIGASLSIRSQPGEGTQVAVVWEEGL